MLITLRDTVNGLIERLNLPVLTQEMRIRQRGVKPFAVMFVYVAVLSIVALVTLSMIIQRPSYPVQAVGVTQNLARQGRQLFTVLLVAQLAMISLIVPAYSAGAVSTERERGTFDLLALTLLSSPSIVLQKLLAAIAQALMLTVASLPVVSLVFMLGGVSPLEIIVAYALLLVTTGAFGALGLLCSCQFRNTRTSTFVAYLSVLGFLVGVPLLGRLLKDFTHMQALSGAFAPTFTLMFAFVSLGCTMPFYVTAAVLLKRYSHHWHSRTFRMLTFGIIYGPIALVLETPSLIDPLVGTLYGYNGSMFLPTLVNPFVALSLLMYGDYQVGGGWASTMQYWSIGLTLIFGTAAIHVFRHMSTFRFEAMRRV